MCPMCMTTVALAAIGTTSAGGLGALALVRERRRRRRDEIDPRPDASEPIGAVDRNDGPFEETR